MSEVVWTISSGLIGAVSGSIGAYLIASHMMSTEHLYGKLDEITEEISKDQRMQQKIYAIGALLGQGIAAGTGLKGFTGQGGGKFKMQDLLMMAASKFFGGAFGQGNQQTEQPQQSEGIGLAKTTR